MEQKTAKLLLSCLFGVPTEAAVTDKTWMNDEEPARLKLVAKCNDPYAM
jgi:hypothetical protein